MTTNVPSSRGEKKGRKKLEFHGFKTSSDSLAGSGEGKRERTRERRRRDVRCNSTEKQGELLLLLPPPTPSYAMLCYASKVLNGDKMPFSFCFCLSFAWAMFQTRARKKKEKERKERKKKTKGDFFGEDSKAGWIGEAASTYVVVGGMKERGERREKREERLLQQPYIPAIKKNDLINWLLGSNI